MSDVVRRTAEEVLQTALGDPWAVRSALAALDRAGYAVVEKDTRPMAERLDDIVCGGATHAG